MRILLVALLLLPTVASADLQRIIQANRQISLHGISTYVDYSESGDGTRVPTNGTLNSEKGAVPGLGIRLSFMGDPQTNPHYLAAAFSKNWGNTRYKGQAVGQYNSYGSVTDDSDATLVDGSLRYGRPFIVKKSAILTPYLEYGTHRWERGVNDGETYRHEYLGLGLLLQQDVTERLVMSGHAMFGRTLNPRIDVTNYFDDKLGASNIIIFGAEADFAFNPRLHGQIGIEQTLFSYGISDVHNGYYEPDSKTANITVRLGIGLVF